MPSKSKSTLTESLILNAAAARRSGHVLPLPNDASPSSRVGTKLLRSMLANGLLEERRTHGAKSVWRTDQDDKHYLLRLTELGRARASDLTQAGEVMQADALIPAPTDKVDHPRGPGGKLGQVLSAVQSGAGASIDDLTALTGWQAHTVRASLTRLRQTGVSIELTGHQGQKRYVGAPSVEAPRP